MSVTTVFFFFFIVTPLLSLFHSPLHLAYHLVLEVQVLLRLCVAFGISSTKELASLLHHCHSYFQSRRKCFPHCSIGNGSSHGSKVVRMLICGLQMKDQYIAWRAARVDGSHCKDLLQSNPSLLSFKDMI